MFFRSLSECQELAPGFGFVADPKVNHIDRSPPFQHEIALSFSDRRDRCYLLAQAFVDWCGDFDHTVMWMTEFGIWPQSENLHLYYTVRRSYGDLRALSEAPGHEFLKHERADLVTFPDMTLLFGWGCLLFGNAQSSCLTVSHDEWIHLASDADLTAVVKEAEGFGLKLLDNPR
jgi:hypothetical protein